jgi:hypothetical protein
MAAVKKETKWSSAGLKKKHRHAQICAGETPNAAYFLL